MFALRTFLYVRVREGRGNPSVSYVQLATSLDASMPGDLRRPPRNGASGASARGKGASGGSARGNGASRASARGNGVSGGDGTGTVAAAKVHLRGVQHCLCRVRTALLGGTLAVLASR